LLAREVHPEPLFNSAYFCQRLSIDLKKFSTISPPRAMASAAPTIIFLLPLVKKSGSFSHPLSIWPHFQPYFWSNNPFLPLFSHNYTLFFSYCQAKNAIIKKFFCKRAFFLRPLAWVHPSFRFLWRLSGRKYGTIARINGKIILLKQWSE